jgi:hypothetical protein
MENLGAYLFAGAFCYLALGSGRSPSHITFLGGEFLLDAPPCARPEVPAVIVGNGRLTEPPKRALFAENSALAAVCIRGRSCATPTSLQGAAFVVPSNTSQKGGFDGCQHHTCIHYRRCRMRAAAGTVRSCWRRGQLMSASWALSFETEKYSITVV